MLCYCIFYPPINLSKGIGVVFFIAVSHKTEVARQAWKKRNTTFMYMFKFKPQNKQISPVSLYIF